MNAAARRPKFALIYVAFPVFWGLIFWAAVCRDGRVPLMATFQAKMAPWSAEASIEDLPTRQWDSLLWDGVAQFYPWRLLLHRSAQEHGELPLWNPYQFCGYPFVGNGQSAMFYPPNWLFFLIHPLKGLAVSACLHTILAGLFTFGLCRCLGLRAEACALAGVAFALGGFMVSWVELPTLTNSATWLPLALWGIEHVRLKRNASGVAMLATALGMTLLAGHMQIGAYVWLAAAGYAALQLLPGKKSHRPRKLALVGVAFGLGLLIGAAQLLPTVELAGMSPRGGGQPTEDGYQFNVQRALKPIELVSLFIPNFLGSPVTNDYPGISYSEHCGYVGALTLILALFGMAVRRDRATVAFAGLALICLLICLGTPLAKLMYFGVPKIGLTGGFTRLFSVYTLCAAVLGGLGLDRLLGMASGKGLSRLALVAFVSWLPWLAAAEVFAWGVTFLPVTKADRVYPATALTTKLQSLPPGRLLAITPRKDWTLLQTPNALLPPNSETVYGLESIQGYDSLFPVSYLNEAAKAEGAIPSPPANGNMVLREKWADRQWAVEGLAYVASREPQPDRIGGVEVLHDLGTFDSVYLYSVAAEPRPPQAAIYYGQGIPSAKAGDITLRGPSALHIQGNWVQSGPLLGPLPDYPGWLIHDDQGQTRPLPVSTDGNRTIPVTNARVIDMVFYPTTVKVGLFLMLIGLSTIIALGVSARDRRTTS